MADASVFDVDIACAQCGSVRRMPPFPPGRGLGGVVHHVRRDHHFVGTYTLEVDEVVVGPQAARQRAAETGADLKQAGERLLDIAGLERLIAEARSTFRPILDALPERQARYKHPLPRLVRRVQDNVDALRAGGREVDVRAALTLERATSAFAHWAQDPSSSRMINQSHDPATFDHNTALLLVASMLEGTELAPELVPETNAPTADLILRISASRSIQVDVKTPRALRFPEADVIKWVEPRETIKRALRRSRGQFVRDGILVIAGEVCFGGIDVYAHTAGDVLHAPLPDDASSDARVHHARLLGILFVSTGYEQLASAGYSFKTGLFMRWVRNPRYAGNIHLHLPADMIGPFRISFPLDPRAEPPPPSAPPAHDARGSVRYRRVGKDVEVEGTMVNQAAEQAPGPTSALRFPEGYRPPTDITLDVACEAGFTDITVCQDGRLMADRSVGWIDLRGVRFPIA